jgi:integrase/recombinase XerD
MSPPPNLRRRHARGSSEAPVTRQRLRAGPAAGHVDGFADWLHHQGYKPVSLDQILRSLAAWADWLASTGFALREALPALTACEAFVSRGQRARFTRGPNKASVSAAPLFVRFLRESGVVPPLEPTLSPVERWPLLGEFRGWMQQQRGLQESSLDTYETVLVDLLEALCDETGTYTAAKVREFVLKRAEPYGIWRAKSITTSVRAFLRFLAATGCCLVGPDHAIPSYASWTLSTTPQFLEPAAVERVLKGCAGEDPRGLRDRAVMLLLARLGLRAGEVTAIARSALRRVGIKAPINGAHVFRHSAATAMLRQGDSLAGVGAVLRHRSPSTTAHYAKIDFGLLAEIAQPWPVPEVPSC